MHERSLVYIVASVIIGLSLSNAVRAEIQSGDCKKCLADAANSLGSDVAIQAVTGALGGGIVGGGPPGAVCGLVIGAASGLATNVQKVFACEKICKAESVVVADPQPAPCVGIANKLKKP